MARLLTRRKLILGLGAATMLAGCEKSRPAAFFLRAMGKWNQGVESAMFSPTRLAPELPPSADTPADAFPSYFISDDMPFPPDNWSLKVGGLVAKPMVLSLDDLKRMARVDLRVRHHCVEGWSAVAGWHGVRVSEIAKAAGADPRVRYVEFRSFDSGYWSSWDLESAMHPQTILAYGMNGHELYPDHGAPLRLYSPVKLGYKTVKYLTEVNFLPNPTGGYWENQGYEWFAGV
ncbi:MAG TPA: molybdopterin-dependent oxidoreductase [Candidatus Binataceae bacterium]|nr:molybdopterin-dependent oxidoreductase [Candidatus Binataceae bacterium]